MKEHGAYLVTFPLFAGIVLAITTIYDISMEIAFYVIAFYMICVTGAYLAAYRFYKKQQEEKEAEVTIDKSEDWEKYQESADFFALWAHQIKTPIAALNVLLQEPEVNTAGCRQELFKIESYVEMALGYTRFENMSNDLVLESYHLEEIVRNVVKKYAVSFIYKHIAIQLDHLDYKILTDDKWFSFVLEQLLSNALKYTMQGEIHIYAREDKNGLLVVISDTGIGIKREDLPRLFERGFTGYNGRMDKKASGLGLYLCKGICNKLGHQIFIESEVGKGTQVIIQMQYEKLNHTDLTKM